MAVLGQLNDQTADDDQTETDARGRHAFFEFRLDATGRAIPKVHVPFTSRAPRRGRDPANHRYPAREHRHDANGALLFGRAAAKQQEEPHTACSKHASARSNLHATRNWRSHAPTVHLARYKCHSATTVAAQYNVSRAGDLFPTSDGVPGHQGARCLMTNSQSEREELTAPIPRRFFRAALAVLALATLSFGLWRGEVEYIKGWTGLNWLHGYPWSALPICALVAASVLIPVASTVPLSRWRSLIFVTITAVISWVSFEIARQWFYTDISWLIAFHVRPDPDYYVFSPLLSIVLTTVGMQQAIHRLLVPIALWTMVFFLVAVLLIVPVSFLALQIVPVPLNRDFYGAIKAGYTAFWTCILLAAAAALATRFRRGSKAAVRASNLRTMLEPGVTGTSANASARSSTSTVPSMDATGRVVVAANTAPTMAGAPVKWSK